MDASDSKLQSAKALQLRGRVAEAEALYREVLRDRPDTALALEGLGVLVFQQGRAAEAAELFARGVVILPESARFHANLGEALRSTDRTEQALPHLRRATELDGTLPHAWNSLALLAYSEGRFADSEASCREAIRLAPRLTAAYINLGNALSALGRPAEAAEALCAGLRIEPHNPLTLMNLAWSLCELNNPASLGEAEELCRRAVALAPQVPTAHKILGNILRLAGRHVEAKACFARAAGGASKRAGWPETAADPPRTGAARHALGMAQLHKGQLDQAEAYFREALALEPRLAPAWNGLARIHAERGDLETSCQAARTAIAFDPRQAEAFWRLATNLNGHVSDAELRTMEELISLSSLSNDDRALLSFALAAAMEHRGRFDLAAARLAQAHAFHSAAKASRSLAYDPDVYTRLIEQIRRVFTADFVAQRRGWGVADPRPVFIVGLPRSGTTLAEQIIASHPNVHGAGELAEVQRIFYALPVIAQQPSLDAWSTLSVLDPATARRGSTPVSRPARLACFRHSRARCRQESREYPVSGFDRAALARSTRDSLPPGSARRGGLVLADDPAASTVEQQSRPPCPALRRL